MTSENTSEPSRKTIIIHHLSPSPLLGSHLSKPEAPENALFVPSLTSWSSCLFLMAGAHLSKGRPSSFSCAPARPCVSVLVAELSVFVLLY